MPILYDDFQSYAIGFTGPWGALTQNPGSTVARIADTPVYDGTQGAYGKTKYLTCSLGGGYFADGTNRADGSVFFSLRRRPGAVAFEGRFLQFGNTSTPSSPLTGHPMFALDMNSDGTFSPYSGSGGPVGVPSNFSFFEDQWTFFQTNVTFSDVAGALHVVWDVGIDGLSVTNGAITYGSVAGMPIPSAIWNQLVIQIGQMSGDFGELTIDTVQSMPTFPNPGSPVSRSTNQIIQLLLVPLPGGPLIRVTTNRQVVGA